MKFWKMNGAGNDFIIINNIEEQIEKEKMPELARRLCDRYFGIGADGLMAVEKPEDPQLANAGMFFFNSDGSAGEMCGNGARCICRYIYENGLSGTEPVIETPAGRVTGTRLAPNLYRIRLNQPSVMKMDLPVTVSGQEILCSYLELGQPGIPHAVLRFEGLREADLSALRILGKQLRYHEAFPKGANVNFYDFSEDGTILLRTYERGVEDFTYACGTGTGSVAAVLAVRGIIHGHAEILSKGGRLAVDVRLKEADGNDPASAVESLYLTGPAEIACKGETELFENSGRTENPFCFDK